jgi:predicted acyl esterase
VYPSSSAFLNHNAVVCWRPLTEGFMRLCRGYLFFLLILVLCGCTHKASHQSPFKFQEVMVPVRDGVHLQTVILTPAGQSGPLPILFRSTPYGVPDKAPEQIGASIKELAQDGYIFVVQNLRGRFKSEGVFNLSSRVDLQDPKATNETTDA